MTDPEYSEESRISRRFITWRLEGQGKWPLKGSDLRTCQETTDGQHGKQKVCTAIGKVFQHHWGYDTEDTADSVVYFMGAVVGFGYLQVGQRT